MMNFKGIFICLLFFGYLSGYHQKVEGQTPSTFQTETSDEAINLNPQYAEAYFHREIAIIAKTRLESSKYKDDDAAHEALLIDPHDIEALFYLGLNQTLSFIFKDDLSLVDETAIKEALDNFDKAIEDIIEFNPFHPYKDDIYYLYGVILTKFGNYNDYKNALHKFDHINPEDTRVHHRNFIVQRMREERACSNHLIKKPSKANL